MVWLLGAFGLYLLNILDEVQMYQYDILVI